MFFKTVACHCCKTGNLSCSSSGICWGRRKKHMTCPSWQTYFCWLQAQSMHLHVLIFTGLMSRQLRAITWGTCLAIEGPCSIIHPNSDLLLRNTSTKLENNVGHTKSNNVQHSTSHALTGKRANIKKKCAAPSHSAADSGYFVLQQWNLQSTTMKNKKIFPLMKGKQMSQHTLQF